MNEEKYATQIRKETANAVATGNQTVRRVVANCFLESKLSVFAMLHPEYKRFSEVDPIHNPAYSN